MLDKVKQLILDGEEEEIGEAVQAALDAGAAPDEVIAAMTATMDVIGERFTAGDIFVPEMLCSAETMSAGMALLKPLLAGGATSSLGKVAIGTVEGDMHDIGKNLVAMMYESAGFDVINLGTDVTTDVFLQTIADNPDLGIVGCSALLTTTMQAMRETVAAIKERYPHVRVMIGGAPTSAAFAAEIGADAYTPDAAAAAAKAKELVSA